MKKLIALLLCLIPILAGAVTMDDFSSDTSPTSDDLIWTTNDPSGEPADRKVTLGNAITKGSGLGTGVVVSSSGTFSVTAPGSDNYLLSGSSDGSTSWVDPSSYLTESNLTTLTIGGFTASRNVEADASGNLTSADTATTGTGAPVKGTDPQISQIQLGHASDTTVARASAGVVSVEGLSLPRIVASGATALDFGSTLTGACATVIQAAATNAVSTDVIIFNANASIKAVTGYVPASTGGFSITAFPTAGYVNFEACNWTAGTVDPNSITVNWMVLR